MEIIGAFFRSVALYFVIGLIAAALNTAFDARSSVSPYERTTAAVQDVILWPRFVVGFASAVDGRLAAMPVEDQPFLYSLLRGGPYGSADQP